MEFPVSENCQLRRLGLQSTDEVGARFNRRDAVAAQFELAGQTRVEDVQVPTIRENRIHPNLTANTTHHITYGHNVTAVPASDE